MATRLGEAFVEISTKNDKLNAGLNDAQRRVNVAVTGMQSDIERLGEETWSRVSKAALVATAAIAYGFYEGIKAVDQYKLATIGIAATLTDMADKGEKDLRGIYASNLRYAQETYEKVELAAAKFFASGKEMVQAWTILTNKGVLLTTDQDINNLGIIVDKIKLMTQGQTSSLQISQELRAVLNGQARATDQIAMLLKDRLGPEWATQLEAARQEGKALEFIAGQFKGLGIATRDITSTLEAQISTTSTLAAQVGRAGLAGAYADIVGVLSDINDYLTVHKNELAGGIREAWADIKALITDPVLTQFFTTVLKGGGESLGIVTEGVKAVAGALRNLLDVYNQFPSEVTGSAGTGIIVRVITGSWSIGAVAAAVDFAVKSAATLAAGLDNLDNSVEGIDKRMAQAKANYIKNTTGDLVLPGFVRHPIPKPPAALPKITPPAPSAAAAGSGGGSRALGFEDILPKLDAFKQKVQDAYKTLESANYDLWIAMAKYSGDYYKAAELEVDKWATDQRYTIDKMVADAQKSFDELTKQMTTHKGGADSAAWEAYAQAEKHLTEVKEIASLRRQALDQQEIQKRRELVKVTLDEAAKTADLNLEYVTLTGTMQEVASATIAKLEADREAAKVGKNEVQKELIDRIALEKEHLEALKATGSQMDGFSYGMKEFYRTMDTDFMRGKEWADMLIKGFDQAADALAEFTMTGKMNFSDFANSVQRDILRMVYKSMLLDMFKGIFGGEAGTGGLGWLSGLFGGAFGGGADLSHTSGLIGPGTEMASGGWITEPIFGIGKSGRRYTLGEAGPEYVSPSGKGTQGTPINVTNHFVINGNPTRESQTQIAASVGNAIQRAMRRNN